jgi:hypothetical protein
MANSIFSLIMSWPYLISIPTWMIIKREETNMVLQDLLHDAGAKRKEQVDKIGKVQLLPCCVDWDKGYQLLSLLQLSIQPAMLNSRCKGGADKREVKGNVAYVDRWQEDPVY